MTPFLSRPALHRVVQSLLRAELHRGRSPRPHVRSSQKAKPTWAEDFDLSQGDDSCLGCDSLERLTLSAAVNEMFHLHEADLEHALLDDTTLGAWLNLIEQAWAFGVRQVTLATSGSTGIPKLCTHSFQALQTEIDFLTTLFQGRSEIIAFTPAHHIYGLLFTALLPDRMCVPVRDWSLGTASDEAGSRSAEAGQLLVAVPEVWSWLDRSTPRWNTNVEGVTSTAPCPRSTIDSLVGKGLARMVEVYGSTETAGIGTRVWPAAAYTLMPHWTRQPDGIYPLSLVSDDRTVIPMDDLDFLTDRCFLPRGRKDGAVQVGGTNVFPSHVEEKLLALPGVQAISVRLMRPEEGTRLKCFVVPAPGYTADDLQASIEATVSTWTSTAEHPKHFTFGSELPRSPMGKPCDW
ncbi:MAG: AMP-binding protein [Janthinobacterium lividum]